MTNYDVRQVYEGSDGKATVALYEALRSLGPAGTIALNLFRACKCSDRAKVYRGGGYKREAYGRKNWSLDNLCAALTEHGEALGIVWGWREDPAQEFHKQVLYVDTPCGQASFHAAVRGKGPDYVKPWNARSRSANRVICWCVSLLRGEQPKQEEPKDADSIQDPSANREPLPTVPVSQERQCVFRF